VGQPLEGPTLDSIARKAQAWAEEYLGEVKAEDLVKKKAQELVYGISQGSRRVLKAMVDIALDGRTPTPPLVMAGLGTKPGDEQGIRAIIGKVRLKMEMLDSSIGGPPLLEKAPFVDSHTQYFFGPNAAAEISSALEGLDKLLQGITRKP
jgi:hypothetical protein